MTTTREIAIRITADNDEALTQFAKQYTGIWCKEEPDLEKHCNRTHYHGYIRTKLTNNGLRKQIYNIFEIPKEKHGNQTLAFTKVTDLEGCLRYICKGTEKTYPNIVYNDLLGVDTFGAHTLKDDDGNYIEDDEGVFFPDDKYYYDEYWKVNKELHDEIKAKRTLKKTAKQNFKDYFINEVLPKYPDDHTRKRLTLYQICSLMYTWYKEHDKELPSKSQGQIIVQDLFLRYTCPQSILQDQILLYYGFKEWHEM